jgi:hypothetical protein
MLGSLITIFLFILIYSYVSWTLPLQNFKNKSFSEKKEVVKKLKDMD